MLRVAVSVVLVARGLAAVPVTTCVTVLDHDTCVLDAYCAWQSCGYCTTGKGDRVVPSPSDSDGMADLPPDKSCKPPLVWVPLNTDPAWSSCQMFNDTEPSGCTVNEFCPNHWPVNVRGRLLRLRHLPFRCVTCCLCCVAALLADASYRALK